MTMNCFLQMALFVAVLLACVKPLGLFMAKVYSGRAPGLEPILGPLERLVYRLGGISRDGEMTWRQYAGALLAFSLASFVAVYGIQRLQGWLPANPESLPAVSPDSCVQYGRELRHEHELARIRGRVHDELPDADARAYRPELPFGGSGNGGAGGADSRLRAARSSSTLGNFWVDLTRGTLYILLPLSLLLAVLLVSQGVVQTLEPYREVTLVEPTVDADGKAVAVQRIAVGPAASQVAIKQLGTNGGGFFNANSAHPLENPTPLSNFLQLLAILLIPASLCYTFGELVGDRRQGWAILAAMSVVFVAMLGLTVVAEQQGNPVLTALGVDQTASDLQAGGNMEGKETRFGIANSALWAVATTAASNGSVNSMHDSFTPLGGLAPMWLMQLGEVIFGGVGSGLYGMLAFAIVAVFLAGLMVGRTPEYLGKKIGAFEMKMASLVILLPCAMVLLGTACAVVAAAGTSDDLQSGAAWIQRGAVRLFLGGEQQRQRLRRLGSQHAVLQRLLGLAMLVGRFWVMLPVLAIAGSLAAKKHVPPGAGTLPTHTPLFVVLLVAVVVVVGALSFFPALALGPIVEHLILGFVTSGGDTP